MDRYSVLWQGLLAGTAALIAGVLVRDRTKKSAFMALFVVLLVGGQALSKEYVEPKLKAWKFGRDVQSAFGSMPAFRALEAVEPAIYQSLTHELTQGAAAGESQAQLTQRVQRRVREAIGRRLPFASDEALKSFSVALLAMLQDARTQSSEACYDALFPSPASHPVKFSEHTQQLTMSAMAEVLRSSTPETLRRDTAIEQLALQNAMVIAVRSVDQRIAQLVADGQLESDKSASCDFGIALLGAVVNLPAAERHQALRAMFSK